MVANAKTSHIHDAVFPTKDMWFKLTDTAPILPYFRAFCLKTQNQVF